MTLEDHGSGRVRRERYAGMSVPLGAGALAAAFAIAVGVPAAHAAAATIRTADVRTADGAVDPLPRLGTACIKDASGNDVVVLGRMTDTTIYTRLFVTFADDAPITVSYDVSPDGTDYRTILDSDYRTEQSREDDYVISLAVDAMKVYSDVCSR